MIIEGREHVAVAISDVWRGLNDTRTYRDCMPELTSLEETRPDHMDAVLELKLPAISGRFEGSLDVLERNEPECLKLRLEGRGGPGFVAGEAELLMNESGDGTDIHYRVEVQVGGQIARLGQRMIAGVSREMAGNFFTSFEQVMQGREKPRAGNPLIAMIRLLWQSLLRVLGISRRGR